VLAAVTALLRGSNDGRGRSWLGRLQGVPVLHTPVRVVRLHERVQILFRNALEQGLDVGAHQSGIGLGGSGHHAGTGRGIRQPVDDNQAAGAAANAVGVEDHRGIDHHAAEADLVKPQPVGVDMVSPTAHREAETAKAHRG